MAVSDHTDVVVRFSDETCAQLFAKFVASEGIPCHVTDIRDSGHAERYGVRVLSSHIEDLRQTLRLTAVADCLSSIAAQSMAAQLASAGIPCYAGGDSAFLVDDSAGADGERKEFGQVLAVPELFASGASRILDLERPSDRVQVPVGDAGAFRNPRHPS